MNSLREQLSLEADEYVIQVEKRQRKQLGRQRLEALTKIMKVEKKIKAVKFKDSEYNTKLELIKKMKEYVEKYAFLPHSYRNMLIRWSN